MPALTATIAAALLILFPHQINNAGHIGVTGALDLATGLPWPQLGYIGLPAFTAGVLIGVTTERRKGELMGYTRTARLWFERWALALYIGLAMITALAVVLSTIATFANNRQDAQRAAENKVRDEQNASLLACFDDFAADLAGVLPPLRAASANRDQASGVRDDALQRVVSLIFTNSTTPPADAEQAHREFLAAVHDLADAGRALDRAQERLARVREKNPYPPPPSTFCSVHAD